VEYWEMLMGKDEVMVIHVSVSGKGLFMLPIYYDYIVFLAEPVIVLQLFLCRKPGVQKVFLLDNLLFDFGLILLVA